MRTLGEVCLLTTFVATGYSAFLSTWGGGAPQGSRRQIALISGIVGTTGLTLAVVVLGWALVSRNFQFEYVVQYSSRTLSWEYCLSALWVGQAGSLLLWAWMTALLAMALRLLPCADPGLRDTAFGFVMGYVSVLVAVMMFGADPMSPSVLASDDGAGLNPLLQHPSMLVHPPIVFLAYAAWSAPCALALAALHLNKLDASWAQLVRPWAILAWSLLGVGLLLGAHWAYQELGWGGYWGWDPVENGSLLPWLTGAAFIHSLLAWRHRDWLKKTALSLALITFGLCNFATFLTRSGIFSSVHAFSESPIGWMFLGIMAFLFIGGLVMIARRRDVLVAVGPPSSLLARESLISASVFLLLVLTSVVMSGTLVAPISKMLIGRTIEVGPAFYNNVLTPIALGLLAMTAVVPLLRWNASPTRIQRQVLAVCLALSVLLVVAAFIAGVRHPTALSIVGLATLAVTAFTAAWRQNGRHSLRRRRGPQFLIVLRRHPRQYMAYFIHLGFVCLAIGVTGSSLGARRQEVELAEGETTRWEDRDIRYVRLEQRELPDRLVAEAVLEISRDGAAPIVLRPARHLHVLQNQWTTEVAIESTWRGDFYTVLDAGLGDGRIALTFINNPLIRCIWTGGIVMTCGAVALMWPSRVKTHTTGSVNWDARLPTGANNLTRAA
jgi:cytochrome c-type biogenesis protein CcmF